MYLASVAAFQTVPTPVASEEYILAGYYSAGDGGGGTFVWVVATTTLPTADGGIIFHRSGVTTGYFKRIYSGPINVRWFGAKGDGTTDDTAAVHATRDSAKNGTIYFPASYDSLGNPQRERGDGAGPPLLSSRPLKMLQLLNRRARTRLVRMFQRIIRNERMKRICNARTAPYRISSFPLNILSPAMSR